jgi:hypothetical protein
MANSNVTIEVDASKLTETLASASERLAKAFENLGASIAKMGAMTMPNSYTSELHHSQTFETLYESKVIVPQHNIQPHTVDWGAFWGDEDEVDLSPTCLPRIGDDVLDETGAVIGTMRADGRVQRAASLEAFAPKGRAIDLKGAVIK